MARQKIKSLDIWLIYPDVLSV